MITYLLSKIFGTKQERDIKRLEPIAEEINEKEPEVSSWPDERFPAETEKLKKELADGASLDEILPIAFAMTREAAKRTIGLRPFDVQLIGGIALHEGKIAEMKTGEGKTLVATMPVYLNSLVGKGVHVVTINDYLAQRDANWMGPVYQFLGLTVGFLQNDMRPQEKRAAYNCEITYGTNNEFGFDYLRDNMVVDAAYKVQRGHHYAIVDEVDSILIDEARTPLIISGPSEESTDKYYRINSLISYISKDKDYQIDEKLHSASLTEDGVRRIERILKLPNLYDPMNIDIIHHIEQALKAHNLFKLDVDYIIKDGEVIIVDEFTGRLMPGRRFSDGLHQALEAKEGVRIKEENQTLATITLQNYFRMYEKLAGMTGTAATEADEFFNIYKLDVVVVPTHRKMIRIDSPDMIYQTEKAKFSAIVSEIEELHKKGQPVLVGTISVEKSERISSMLKKKGIPHQVLNAKYHEMEAEIVAQAGRKAQVTIATNMAGRGTDIVLGGNPPNQAEHEEVVRLGGLHILGSERHEARRIDNQLRGRSARQGDPGSSSFYISLEDDLMRLFGSERISGIMTKLGLKEDEVIEHPWISKSIERAQKQVEAHNFDIRKRLLEFDDVMNKQRSFIYKERDILLAEEDLSPHLIEMIDELTDTLFDAHISEENQDVEGLQRAISRTFQISPKLSENDPVELKENLKRSIFEGWEIKKKELGEDFVGIQKMIMLSVLDNLWKDHLHNMDALKEGVYLRAYGQKDPLVEYRREGFGMFEELIYAMKEETVSRIFLIQIQKQMLRKESLSTKKGMQAIEEAPISAKRKIGRNDPCPCGSGKKYKYCHGK
ncbi:MAG: preprotein translocase subunit SecA [bacterium]|nr:preprotein translocase subunit SecA [bacterium]